MIHQTLLSGYEGQVLLDSADFDGANDYMTTGAGLTGAADSKSGIFSCWVRLDGGDGNILRILEGTTTIGGATGRVQILRGGGNDFIFFLISSGGTTAVGMTTSTATFTASATWYHILASWDAATGAEHLYINDVSDIVVTNNNDVAIDYTLADWSIGARPDAAGKFNGCLAELYFAPGQYLDFSLVPNRRRFRSGNGKPIWLGADAVLPTGIAPLIYQHLDDGEAVANFALNAGTGGNFTIVSTLATGSTSPSD